MRVLKEEFGTFVSNCENAKQIKVIEITRQTPHTPLKTGITEYINSGKEYQSHTGEILQHVDDNTFQDLNGVQYFRC